MNIIQINQTASYLMNKKWVLLQSVKGELSIHYQMFCRHQHWGSLHGYSETRSRSNVNGAFKHTKRHSYDKTHFSVRPHDCLHLSPINSALYVVIMFVLVCLRRFLWQIILLTYTSYKLVVHFDLSLDLFQGDFWISSHYSLTVYHLQLRTNSVNIVLTNSTHTLLKYM